MAGPLVQGVLEAPPTRLHDALAAVLKLAASVLH